MWGDDNLADIEINTMFEELEPGTYIEVLCEGCGLVCIGKTSNNEMILAVLNKEKINWMPKDAFMELPQHF